jgi:hypothetical protein
MRFFAGDVLAGVDVDIAHACKYQATFAEDSGGRSEIGADLRDDAVVDGDLAVTHAIDVGQHAFNDLHNGGPKQGMTKE